MYSSGFFPHSDFFLSKGFFLSVVFSPEHFRNALNKFGSTVEYDYIMMHCSLYLCCKLSFGFWFWLVVDVSVIYISAGSPRKLPGHPTDVYGGVYGCVAHAER